MTTTTRRATATGLPDEPSFTPTRRHLGALLGALASLPPATTLAKAETPALGVPAADQEVFELTRLYDAAKRRDEEVTEACAAADETGDSIAIAAAQEAYRAAWLDEMKPLRMRILDLRSATPAVLRLKVRVYVDSMSCISWRAGLDENVAFGIKADNGPWEEAFAASILRDVVLESQTLDRGRESACPARRDGPRPGS